MVKNQRWNGFDPRCFMSASTLSGRAPETGGWYYCKTEEPLWWEKWKKCKEEAEPLLYNLFKQEDLNSCTKSIYSLAYI